MSRIGKKPILIPAGVQAQVDGQKVTIKGPKGELSREVRPEIKVEAKEGKITVSLFKEGKHLSAFWGLTRALLNNMVKGVTEGYEKKLSVEGLGYKAAVNGKDLVLQVGFTHSINVAAPEGIKFSVEKNVITVSGNNNELVGQTAAKIRKIRPPEPYKGTGIRYLGEVVRRKAGKKVVSSAG